MSVQGILGLIVQKMWIMKQEISLLLRLFSHLVRFGCKYLFCFSFSAVSLLSNSSDLILTNKHIKLEIALNVFFFDNLKTFLTSYEIFYYWH